MQEQTVSMLLTVFVHVSCLKHLQQPEKAVLQSAVRVWLLQLPQNLKLHTIFIVGLGPLTAVVSASHDWHSREVLFLHDFDNDQTLSCLGCEVTFMCIKNIQKGGELRDAIGCDFDFFISTKIQSFLQPKTQLFNLFIELQK